MRYPVAAHKVGNCLSGCVMTLTNRQVTLKANRDGIRYFQTATGRPAGIFRLGDETNRNFNDRAELIDSMADIQKRLEQFDVSSEDLVICLEGCASR